MAFTLFFSKQDKEGLEKKSQELNKQIQSQDAVIKWLNKGLNEAQARDPHLRLGPPPPGIHHPIQASATSTPRM